MKKDSDIDDLPSMIPDISDRVLESFQLYFDILTQFNSRMNLVANSTLCIAGRRHFADSYLGIQSFEKDIPSNETVYDFGSGNGFPGIVLAIMRQDVGVLLIERDRRKVEFLKHLAFSLGLKNVEVANTDAKNLNIGPARFGISRAMSPMPRILFETREAILDGGHLFLFKGEYWTGEFGNVPAVLFDFWDVTVKTTYQLVKTDVRKVIIDCLRIEA